MKNKSQMLNEKEPEFKKVFRLKLIFFILPFVLGILGGVLITAVPAIPQIGAIFLFLFVIAVITMIPISHISCSKYRHLNAEALLYIGFSEKYVKVNGVKYRLSCTQKTKTFTIYECSAENDTHFETFIHATGKVQGLKINGTLAERIR